MDRELCGREEPPLVHRLPAGAAARSAVGATHRSVWHHPHPHLGAVVQSERVPAGGAGCGGGLLHGGDAAVGLPPVPGLHQLHHLGVHVTPQDLLPEELQ